eukprot:jgi/Ulvmu1/11890/UM081_0048.1
MRQWSYGSALPWRWTSPCSGRYASNSALDDIERQLKSSIRSQSERIAKIDSAFKTQAQAGPWRMVAIATSGFALICAVRLYMDKREYQANQAALQASVNEQQHIIIKLEQELNQAKAAAPKRRGS